MVPKSPQSVVKLERKTLGKIDETICIKTRKQLLDLYQFFSYTVNKLFRRKFKSIKGRQFLTSDSYSLTPVNGFQSKNKAGLIKCGYAEFHESHFPNLLIRAVHFTLSQLQIIGVV